MQNVQQISIAKRMLVLIFSAFVREWWCTPFFIFFRSFAEFRTQVEKSFLFILCATFPIIFYSNEFGFHESFEGHLAKHLICNSMQFLSRALPQKWHRSAFSTAKLPPRILFLFLLITCALSNALACTISMGWKRRWKHILCITYTILFDQWHGISRKWLQ